MIIFRTGLPFVKLNFSYIGEGEISKDKRRQCTLVEMGGARGVGWRC
jgi:hypothetical protein